MPAYSIEFAPRSAARPRIRASVRYRLLLRMAFGIGFSSRGGRLGIREGIRARDGAGAAGYHVAGPLPWRAAPGAVRW
ncbi:hypothetical protein GCM10009863_49040 [Streptomyces axinellae]|uniref:Uncharacterized protein n=1 Tax=Streptomyces axinellae TaxID=552788 RepID=A0ABP6CZ50_9ACTN